MPASSSRHIEPLLPTAKAYKLTASPGSIAITGATAGTPVHRVMSASPGSFTITGATANVPVHRIMVAAPGVYTITGSPVTFVHGVKTGDIIDVQRPYGSLWNHPY